MKKGLVFTLICCALTGARFAAHPGMPAAYVAVEHVTLIDGTGSRARSDITVLLEGNRIRAIESSDHFRPPKGAQIVNGRGKFLIPGLWDMHVHIAGISADPLWSKEVLLPLFVANGITGVRDMGGDLKSLQAWRKQIDGGSLTGPHIVACGPMLDRGGERPSPEISAVRTPAEAQKAVLDLKSQGADFIKVLSSLTRESYYAVAQESKAQHLDLVGHVPYSITAAEASDAGQKSIEHIFYSNLMFDCSTRADELRQRQREEMEKRSATGIAALISEANKSYSPERAAVLGQKLRANGTWLVPTLIGIYPLGHFEELAKDTSRLKYLPTKLTREWTLEKLRKQYPAKYVDFYGQQSDSEVKILGDLHRAGVKILAGSDSLDLLNVCGFSLHQELALLVQAGLTPMEALQSATSNPAIFLGRQNDLGTIEIGKIADLVLLDANPLDDIHNSTRIKAVFVNGKLHSYADIEALLTRAVTFAASVRSQP